MVFEWLHGIPPDTALDPLFGQTTLKSREMEVHAHPYFICWQALAGYLPRTCLRMQRICLLLNHFKSVLDEQYDIANILFPSKFGGPALALSHTETTHLERSKCLGYDPHSTVFAVLIHEHKCQPVRQAAVQASC